MNIHCFIFIRCSGNSRRQNINVNSIQTQYEFNTNVIRIQLDVNTKCIQNEHNAIKVYKHSI